MSLRFQRLLLIFLSLIFLTASIFLILFSGILSNLAESAVSGAIIFGITLAVFSVEKEKFKSLELG